MSLHPWNGFPMKPNKHLQMALWLITLHWEFSPQEFEHGSWHFVLMQAKLFGHSALIEHSGRQCGGVPI